VKNDIVFAGSIADFYERELVPILFEPFADDLVQRVGDAREILELAAGTGVVTRRLVRECPEASIVATDLNPDMLSIAAERAPGVTIRTADALELPFEDASFDAIVCQFGVMFFPDKERAFRETLRVLRPNGRYIFSVWRSLEYNDFANAIEVAIRPALGNPSFLARVPFNYDVPNDLLVWLENSGFRSITIETVEKIISAQSAQQVVDAFAKGCPLYTELEQLGLKARDAALDSAVRAVREGFGDGAVQARAAALVVQAERS
jgi:ubiquinone/menaquinone biosynthesis C-methylase UbiE